MKSHHTVMATQEGLQWHRTVNLWWFPNSLNHNPLERFWRIFKEQLYACYPKNAEELRQYIREIYQICSDTVEPCGNGVRK
jgi:hypothetical protein